MEFSKSLLVRILMVILLVQAVAYYAVASRSEKIPFMAPLAAFPRNFANWTLDVEFPIEKEVQDVLKADDTLNRIYVTPGRAASVSFFIAYFKTQRYGQSPHSPKNCLPGSGWQANEDRTVSVALSGNTRILIKEYVVGRGEQESVVLYWYQSHGRVIAHELDAKMWLVADAIRYHRSDTALVRVIAPVTNNDRAAAERTALDFVRDVYPHVVVQLPR
jgi:EpsI family protein